MKSRETINREYNEAWHKASRENDAAHDAYPPIEIGGVRKVKIERGYQRLPADTYNTDKTFLALMNGNWVIGRVGYLPSQQRFTFSWFWGANSLQVEHLHQLYEIDMPIVPDRLVPDPIRPAELDEDYGDDDDE